MSRDITNESPLRFVFSATIAALLSFLGWAGMHFGQKKPGLDWLYLVGLVVQFPGGLTAALVAMIVSPQGGHGIDDYLWLMPPMTALFYFFVLHHVFSGRQKSL